MITGVHTLFYTRQADAVRVFLRDVLGFKSVDAGGGWLIFALPPGELGVHPQEDGPDRHELWLMCDDINATIDELRAKGVSASAVEDHGWGLVTRLSIPAAGEIHLYQPRHPMPPR